MADKIIIKENNNENQLIEANEIRKSLISNDDKLTLVFEIGKTDDNYRQYLQKELPNHHVLNVRWMPELWISPSIATSKILENSEDIYQAALSFRRDGTQLIKMLGEAYQINPFIGRNLFDIKGKSLLSKQRGKVNEAWNFWFHGAECQFKNHLTGQIIEIVITNGPEFGALDSFFFLQYLRTTPKFHNIARLVSDHSSSVTKVLNILEDLGKLKRIDNSSQRGIIAV